MKRATPNCHQVTEARMLKIPQIWGLAVKSDGGKVGSMIKYFHWSWAIFCIGLYGVIWASFILSFSVWGLYLQILIFVGLPLIMLLVYELPYDIMHAFKNGFPLPDEEDSITLKGLLFLRRLDNEQGIVDDKNQQ